MRNSFANILKEIEDSGRVRLAAKVPQWYGIDGLEIPTRLCTEQCSSAATALYKARLLGDISGAGARIADLTGGLGVDSWAFSKAAVAVLHNEMDAELSGAVERNFRRLGVTNAIFSSIKVTTDSIGGILDSFRPDAVYMDPARRSAAGSKVFRLADCVPNVLELIPAIFQRCGTLLLKLSPMADLTQITTELDAAGAAGGAAVSEMHILGAGGECKEVLVLMGIPGREEKGKGKGYGITVTDAASGASFSFRPEEEEAAQARIASPEGSGGWLFEPGKALAKSGAFKLTSDRFGLGKLGVSTHLYLANEPVDALRGLGKWFRIIGSFPLDKRTMKECGKKHPAASVSARNLPFNSEELRKRMGITREGDTHIFGAKSDCSGNLLLICLPEKFA